MARKPSAPSPAAVIRLLDHPRAQVSWVCRAEGDKIVRMARLVSVTAPAKTRVLVQDWGIDGNAPVNNFLGAAGGYGYDRTTAALSGATVGGVTLGDHCGENPTLGTHASARGWQVIGGGRFT
jgi:hypothetical protein